MLLVFRVSIECMSYLQMKSVVFGCFGLLVKKNSYFFSGNKIAKCDLKTCLASWLKGLAFLPPNGSLGLNLLQISPTAWGYQWDILCCVCISPRVSDNPNCWISWPRIFFPRKRTIFQVTKTQSAVVAFFLEDPNGLGLRILPMSEPHSFPYNFSHHRGDLAKSPQKWPYYTLLSG